VRASALFSVSRKDNPVDDHTCYGCGRVFTPLSTLNVELCPVCASDYTDEDTDEWYDIDYQAEA
jgi:rRNA maturation endonuclease Nob1